MRRSLVLGFVPYLATIVGIPFVNTDDIVLGLPLLALWICVWVVLTPLFLHLAQRALPEHERGEGA